MKTSAALFLVIKMKQEVHRETERSAVAGIRSRNDKHPQHAGPDTRRKIRLEAARQIDGFRQACRTSRRIAELGGDEYPSGCAGPCALGSAGVRAVRWEVTSRRARYF